MRKLTKGIIGTCAAFTVLSCVSSVALAYQRCSNWGTKIDFWVDTLSSDITETDSDYISHVKWFGKESTKNFKLKFTIRSIDDRNVCNTKYIDSTYQLGRTVSIYDSNCIKGRQYTLVAARENLFDSAVYCAGDWEP